MSMEKVDTLVVGAGQAGIALSEHLSNNQVPHLVLERSRVAEAWRSGRWDSLVANGPAWHDRFPNMNFPCGQDEFATKERVADYLNDYAQMIQAPIRTGVEVQKAERMNGRAGFRVQTSDGVIEAQNVVAATGAFQHPVIPPVVPQEAPVAQLHSFHYRNPEQLPDGAVIVIGAGSSGAQISDELNRAGRKVYLSVGPHERPPRAYRGRDFCWWLGVLGLWDVAAMAPGKEHVTIAVSGAYGGNTMDFRRLGNEGITLLGMTRSYKDGVLGFGDDLKANVAGGDASYLKMLDGADAYVARTGIDLPEDPEARVPQPDPDCLINPLTALNLSEAGISTIIWATGFRQDFSWMKVDAFDEKGAPRHQRGVSTEPGIYFLGLPWQSRRGSTFIWGVWHDAKHIADQIANQRKYLAYRDPND
ncbi:NAD(P)/FAD-dependent oxidoreductase [Thalassococcus sp. S3]|uniref:flavin-containing monooxygenase n=1 Tax=Thalassococcus sp. S3 TaxID=2017482 RepID=UPI00102416D7|nr:NAD(P)/FAD-dependent oxidoreductase [Thalassococcus sp. S3]QBF30216.1 FAD-dependent oxidoreductase [Thalassococcus sp. S3]